MRAGVRLGPPLAWEAATKPTKRSCEDTNLSLLENAKQPTHFLLPSVNMSTWDYCAFTTVVTRPGRRLSATTSAAKRSTALDLPSPRGFKLG